MRKAGSTRKGKGMEMVMGHLMGRGRERKRRAKLWEYNAKTMMGRKGKGERGLGIR